jgi:hypothetical protein
VTEKVVRCDLRPCDEADKAIQEVARVLADQSKPDLRMLLVLDTPQTLSKHALAYEELWRSRRVEKLLGVAVGPLILPGGLELPGSIGPDGDSGVIWVGDEGGVDWRLAASAIANAHPNDNEATGLDLLLDILSVPQVFTKALGLISEIPERVANPGLDVFEVSASQTMFLGALNRSIKKMLAPDTVDMRNRLAAADESAWAVENVRSTIVPTGRLASARDRCLAEAEALTETTDALGTSGALYGAGRLGARARALAASAGTELGNFRAVVQTLVSAPAIERVDRFFDWGIRPVTNSDTEHGDVAAAIETSVRAGEQLRLVSVRLRDYERRVRSAGDPAYSEQIERLSPPALEQRFVDPEPMPGPEPWLVAVGALATAMAAIGQSFGIVAGLVVALSWTGLLGLTIARAPAGRLADYYGSLVASGIAALFGLACGTILARALKPPAVPGGIGFLVGLIVVISATTWSWLVRTRRWRDTLRVEDIVRSAEGLTNVAVTAANREWSAGESRQDAMITAKAAIDGAASALRTYQEKVDRDPSHDTARYRTQQEFDSFVGQGLAQLVAYALSPILRASKPGSPREHEEWARTRVAELLAGWDKYVEDHGPLDLPDFASRDDMDISVFGSNDIEAITAIITSDPRDVMWQLCRSVDISMLDTGVTRVAVVRFAPRAVLFRASDAIRVETEWINSMSHAGMLRLVPLRQGIVSRSWLTYDEPSGAYGPEGYQPPDAEEMP